MGKSSSSLKRKRAKKSSKVHDKSKSGRRSRKSKSKKVHLRDDYFSSSDEDYSSSVSSSSTDDSYRKRKSWSRTRKYVKGHKKRARRHSCSTENSEQSIGDRKRKRSKRKDVDSDVKKKKSYKKKKKPRKEASICSTCSEPRSCSTCQTRSESSDSEYENSRSRLDRRENDGKNSEGGGNETNRYKSRSSSVSCNDSHDLYDVDNCNVQKTSRQLKSVITIPHDVEVDGKSPLDAMRNEEHGRKCFCCSRGSLVGYPERESVCPMEIKFQKEAQGEIEEGEENADIEGQYARKETSEVSGAAGSFQSVDLESILRERALENLRKFRQEFQINGKASDHKTEMNSAAIKNREEKEEQSKTMPTVGNGMFVGRKSGKESLVEGQPSAPSLSRDGLSSSSNADRTHDGDLGSHKSDPARHELAEGNDQSISKLVQGINMPAASPQASKVEPVLKQEIVNLGSKNIVEHVNISNPSVPKLSSSVVSPSHHHQGELQLPYKDKGVSQETRPQVVSHSIQLENAFGLDVSASSEQTMARSISNVEKDLDAVPSTLRSSSCKPSSKKCSSNKVQDEASDSSQFEQKTMQVMRGGEMVQVSYKVYIPKKAPALSRRQLKR